MVWTLVPTSGELPFGLVQIEMGNVGNPLVLSDYRGIDNVPATGPIDASDFYGINGNPYQSFTYESGKQEQDFKGNVTTLYGIGLWSGFTLITAGVWTSAVGTVYGHTQYHFSAPFVANQFPTQIWVAVQGFTADPGQDYLRDVRLTVQETGTTIFSETINAYNYDSGRTEAQWQFGSVQSSGDHRDLYDTGVDMLSEVHWG